MPRGCEREARAGGWPPGFFRFGTAALLLLTSLPVAGSQESPVVRSIVFTGNRALTAADLLASMHTSVGRPFDAADLQRIIERYVHEGYPHAGIDSVDIRASADNSSVDVAIAIREGKPAAVGSIGLEGARAIGEQELLSELTTREGSRFFPAVLEDDIRRLLQRYEKAGFAFASISLGSLTFSEHETSLTAEISLQVEEGPVVVISELRVEGNRTTKQSVIVREARLKPGEPFRGDQPARIKHRLERTGLFSSVATPQLYLNQDGTAGFLLRVTESNPNRLDGILGYVPSARAAERGYLTGLLDIHFGNILGTGRKLSTRWAREDRTTQELQLGYMEPWVASLPVNLHGDFFQRKQDTTYVRRKYTLAADLMLTEELSVGASFGYASVIPSEGMGGRAVAESRSTSFGVSVFYDTRDDPLMPTKGWLYRSEYHTGFKRVSGSVAGVEGSRSSTQQLTFDFEHYFTLLPRQVVVTSLSARDIRSGRLDVSDLHRLGGAGTLRGYREGQFLGSRVAWGGAEYRLVVGARSFAFGFLDLGFIATPDRPDAGIVKSEQRKVGYGIGVRLDSPLGLIGVSVALGEKDTFSTAKLHIRLINRF